MKEICKNCKIEYDASGIGYHLKIKHNINVEDYILEHYGIPKSVVNWRCLSVENAIFAKNLLDNQNLFNNYFDLFQNLYDQHNNMEELNQFFGHKMARKICECLGIKINRNLSEEHKLKISNKRKGKKLSDEHKKSISIGLFNQENKKERYEKLSKQMSGHQHSKKSILKMIKNRTNPEKPFRGKGGFREDLGHFVRSTWEANVARVLNLTAHRYEFEPQTFWITLPNRKVLSYTPDFYLPTEDTYIEVKGYWMDDAKEKFDLLKEQYPHLRIEVIDKDRYDELIRDYSPWIKEWE